MLKNGRLINGEARIETSNKCNAHCTICPREKMTREKKVMCYGVFCNLVDQVRDLGAETISLFGYGEPLTDPGLEDKIEYCTSFRLNTWITTNGGLLTQERAQNLVYAGLKNIRFSFHGLYPIDYEEVHDGIGWLTAWGNFYNFIMCNKQHGSPCKVHISSIPMHGETVDAICATWERYCDYLEIWKPHNWAGGKGYRESKRVKNTCGRPFSGPVQIQADGTMIPCCFITNSEIVLGDTTDASVEEVLKNDAYNRLREAHMTGDLNGYVCRSCDQLNQEEENPLLYSTRDPRREIGKTSTCKIDVKQTSTI